MPGVHNDPLFDAFRPPGDRLRMVHARHEQGAAYMALGAALATGKPQAFAVVPGPGFLNAGAALLTAYDERAGDGLVGQIPRPRSAAAAAICTRSATSSASRPPGHLPPASAAARGAATGRQALRGDAPAARGPVAVECAMDVWGKRDAAARRRSCLTPPAPAIDEDAVRATRKNAGRAKKAADRGRRRRPGRRRRSDALAENDRRARRSPTAAATAWFRPATIGSRQLPIGHRLWKEADVVMAIGTRLLIARTNGASTRT